VTAPPVTLFTFPVAFSKTKKSFAPKNAIAVGVSNPLTTVRAAKFRSTKAGCATTASAQHIAAKTETIRPLQKQKPFQHLSFIDPPIHVIKAQALFATCARSCKRINPKDKFRRAFA
jgi:hypothetical protein